MKGIIFNDIFIPIIAKGNKTMTRRIVNPQPIVDAESGYVYFKKHMLDIHTWQDDIIKYARYKVGEIVYIKEACGRISGIMFYRTDYPEKHKMRTNFAGWRNKMFMKAESARYKIRITDVRLERVQDITNEDAWREGVSDSPEYNCIALFQNKWIKINGISSWKPNPFVFVYCFERL